MKLRLAGLIAEKDSPKMKAMLDELQSEATGALENVRDLARGIQPPLLADQGLVAALSSHGRRALLPVTIDADGLGRYPEEAKAAVYFCCLEALQNVAKYARANRIVVQLHEEQGFLTFEVADDGIGFDPKARGYGTGLQGMSDRLAALDGELSVTSSPAQERRSPGAFVFRCPIRTEQPSGSDFSTRRPGQPTPQLKIFSGVMRIRAP